jgi:hypothetical protein
MAESTEITIGAAAKCLDGPCGEVSRVVVDPVALAVTHLVVEPDHRSGLGKLVPLDIVDLGSGEIRVHCTQAEFDRLGAAEETQFLPGNYGGYGGYGPGQMVVLPHYLLSDVNVADGGYNVGNAFQPVVSDTLPAGEVAVRRDKEVHAVDGTIGRVEGLVMDARDHQVTHVLLQEGHLWGRKRVAIPIGALSGIDDAGIHLNVTRQVVRDLPAVDIEDPSEGLRA